MREWRIVLTSLALAACSPWTQAAESTPTPQPAGESSPCLPGEVEVGSFADTDWPDMQKEGDTMHILDTLYGQSAIFTYVNRRGVACGSTTIFEPGNMPEPIPVA